MNSTLSASHDVRRFTMSEVITGNTMEIGNGFSARGFRYAEIGEMMDPLIMVDHYTMTESTFGAHGHAGISAVSILLEDSIGAFRNQDSLGNDIDLHPGDLFWLKAGKGAVHDEKPRAGSKAHGLQVFVNLPAKEKYDDPDSLLVRSTQVPIIENNGARVRVLIGQSNGVVGVASPSVPLTILDGKLKPGKSFQHSVEPRSHVWVQVVSGIASVSFHGVSTSVGEGQAIAVSGLGDTSDVEMSSEEGAQFILIEGQPISEPVVQRGPFAMNSEEEVHAVEEAYRRGEFGTIL